MEQILLRIKEFDDLKLPFSPHANKNLNSLLSCLYADSRIEKVEDPVVFLNNFDEGERFDFYELKWKTLSCIIVDDRVSIYCCCEDPNHTETKRSIFRIPENGVLEEQEIKIIFVQAKNFILKFLCQYNVK